MDELVDRAEFGRSAAAQLIAYRVLGDNWDDEGAAAPSETAIGSALAMLEATPPHLGLPTPMVLASGDVALYWDLGETYAEIGFDGTGRYYAYGTAPGLPTVRLDDVPVADELGRCAFPRLIEDLLMSGGSEATA